MVIPCKSAMKRPCITLVYIDNISKRVCIRGSKFIYSIPRATYTSKEDIDLSRAVMDSCWNLNIQMNQVKVIN